MMRLMDNPTLESPPQPESVQQSEDVAEGVEQQPREPAFFSDNVASLGRTLARVKSAAIVMHDRGQSVSQTVRYTLQ